MHALWISAAFDSSLRSSLKPFRLAPLAQRPGDTRPGDSQRPAQHRVGFRPRDGGAP